MRTNLHMAVKLKLKLNNILLFHIWTFLKVKYIVCNYMCI